MKLSPAITSPIQNRPARRRFSPGQRQTVPDPQRPPAASHLWAETAVARGGFRPQPDPARSLPGGTPYLSDFEPRDPATMAKCGRHMSREQRVDRHTFMIAVDYWLPATTNQPRS